MIADDGTRHLRRIFWNGQDARDLSIVAVEMTTVTPDPQGRRGRSRLWYGRPDRGTRGGACRHYRKMSREAGSGLGRERTGMLRGRAISRIMTPASCFRCLTIEAS
jgi:hypothetical protein